MKKTLFIILIIVTIFSLSTLCVSAEEVNSEAAEDAIEVTEGENTSDGAITEDTTTVFDDVYAAVTAHASEILSAAACLCSALLMFFYKKGFLPLVKGGLCAISNGVEAIERGAEKQSSENESLGKLLEEGIARVGDGMKELSDTCRDFGDRLKGCEDQAKLTASFRSVLTTQIDLMYEIFMSSSLPQYEKDRIGTMVSDMKSKLNKAGGTDDEACGTLT